MPFDFKKFDAKCAGLDAQELQREWQHYTRLITGAATSTTVSGLAIPLTAGVSTIGVALAAPAIHNARKKREIIERHLNRLNTTHQTRKRDVLGGVAVSGTIGVVTLGVGTLGADAIAAHGAEHGISAIVENETAIKVVSHVALDGVGLGVEHAHTNHLRKRDARKAFEKAGVFKAVEDAKAAEAGYSIQSYNPYGVAAESSASLPYYAPPPPYSYTSGQGHDGIPENYNVAPMSTDPYYGLDPNSKAPMPPLYQPQQSQEVQFGNQSEDFAPPSMPPPNFPGVYDMHAMGAALPMTTPAMLACPSVEIHPQNVPDASRSMPTEKQGLLGPSNENAQSQASPVGFGVLSQASLTELPVNMIQPPTSAPPAAAVVSLPVSVGVSAFSPLPPIGVGPGNSDPRTQNTQAELEFMYPPPVAPPPGHVTHAQSIPLADTPAPLNITQKVALPAVGNSSLLPATITPVVSPDVHANAVLANTQPEPQTPYEPARGTLTGYSSQPIQQPLSQTHNLQANDADNLPGQSTGHFGWPNQSTAATQSGIPMIPQTPLPRSQSSLRTLQSPSSQVQAQPNFQHLSTIQPGSLQSHLAAPATPKPLNASRRASIASTPAYSQRNYSPLQSTQEQYSQSQLQYTPRYTPDSLQQQNLLPSGPALPPTPQSLPTSPPAGQENSKTLSYFPAGAFTVSNSIPEHRASVSYSSTSALTGHEPQKLTDLLPQQHMVPPVSNLPATPLASPPGAG